MYRAEILRIDTSINVLSTIKFSDFYLTLIKRYGTVTVHTDLDDIILNNKDNHCHTPELKEIQI